jgi:hypothetical protein
MTFRSDYEHIWTESLSRNVSCEGRIWLPVTICSRGSEGQLEKVSFSQVNESS